MQPGGSHSNGPDAAASLRARLRTALEPTVWAVGGGKGGVGKTLFSVNLAVAMARRGERVVLVDADLGGANCHTVLGLASPQRCLADFISRKVERLDEVLVPTTIPNLWLASGSRGLEAANPRHVQKLKLLRHVRQLDVDHVLMDLGAGSAFNVLDFFLAADERIVVVAPEPTSIENAYHFLKSAFYRSLRDTAKKGQRKTLIQNLLEERMKRGIRSPRALVAAVTEVDAEAGEVLAERVQRFSAHLVVNQARRAEHQRLGAEMELACQEYFGARITHLATLPREDEVLDAIAERAVVYERSPNADFSRAIRGLAEHLGSREP
ncbi:MAG: P-loop NTPase [Deltaproteobacteria bacterium]|nr:P-loop NTPase [Deltaproteobacteria bacterium]